MSKEPESESESERFEKELALSILMGYAEMASEAIERLKEARDKLGSVMKEWEEKNGTSE